MGLFGNSSSQNGPPVDAVVQLRSRGSSDHDIIDALSKQGYSSIDIYNALNQADSAPRQSQQPQPEPQAPQNTQQYPSQPESAQPQQPMQQPKQQDPWNDTDDWSNLAQEPADPWSQQSSPPIVHAQPSSQPEQQPQAQRPPQPRAQPSPEPPAPQPEQASQSQQPVQQPSQPQYVQPEQLMPPQHQNAAPQPSRSAPVFGGSDETLDQIDQVAEAIIDEKWKDLKAYIEKIIDWKGKVETRIIAIEQNQKALSEQVIGLQKSLVDKVQTYDRHITDVGTEIKAMEKVFQKIIPSLTENVNELSSVVHRMKDD